MKQFPRIWLYYCFAGMLCITGCSAVSTEDGLKYSISMDEQHYRNRETFDHIYALQKKVKGQEVTTAIVFDFKNDAFTVKPDTANSSGDNNWDNIVDDDILNRAMNSVRDAKSQVITIKPCSDCERIAVGTIYSDRTMGYSFKPDDMSILFAPFQFPSSKGG